MAASVTPKANGQGADVRTMLGAISQEMESLAHGIGKVEAAVGALSGKVVAVGEGVLQELQRLDLTRQMLEDLATVSQALVSQLPDGISVDVDRVVRQAKLSDLADRLRSIAPSPARSHSSEFSDIEFF